jgi:hypothetical protein
VTAAAPPPWLRLLAPIPPEHGTCERVKLRGKAFKGWTEVRLAVADAQSNLRVVTVIYDALGRPGSISDLVESAEGRIQEVAMARVERDGRLSGGTHSRIVGDDESTRPMTEEEQARLRALASQLNDRKSRLG